MDRKGTGLVWFVNNRYVLSRNGIRLTALFKIVFLFVTQTSNVVLFYNYCEIFDHCIVFI